MATTNDLGYRPDEILDYDFNAIDPSEETTNNEQLFTSEPAINGTFDEHVGSLLKIPFDDKEQILQIISRKCSEHAVDGRLAGTKHSNPQLDTRIYNVQMPNGEIREYTANLVVEKLFAQCDEVGNYAILIDEIIDYKHDNSAQLIGKDTYFDKRHGKEIPVQNFQG